MGIKSDYCPTRAGKTTFCDLVRKNQPSTGRIYFDEKEITQMDESILLERIGQIQTPTVFDS